MSNWYQRDVADVLQELEANPATGLSTEVASVRFEKFGPNELVETGQRGPLRILWEQFSSAMIVMLVIAAVVSAFLGEYEDAIVILAIVVLNALLGFFQDYRAERAMAALKQMAVPKVRVRRNGDLQEISSHQLVPGDVVILETGNLVPADCRLIETQNLRNQEAALTGESAAVDKTTEALPDPDLSLGDQFNMAFMGTVVTYGRGLGVVTATGMHTELGHIARMLQSVQGDQTPLQRRLARLGRNLAVAAVVIVAVVFTLGLLRGEDPRLMIMTAMSMAVAAVPEGLPAVATVTLALGARRMLRRNALIRQLPAVETLGSVTVICSDKTGTLTENRMTVTVLEFAGNTFEFQDHLAPGEVVDAPEDERLQVVREQPAIALLLAGGGLCSDAQLERAPGDSSELEALGDPTEGAIVVAAARLGMPKTDLDRMYPRVFEVPFDSDRKRMTTVHRMPSQSDPSVGGAALQQVPGCDGWNYLSLTKGAVDGILDASTQVWTDGRPVPLDDHWRERIATAQEELAAKGRRVLGLAFKPLESAPRDGTGEGLERDLIFVGMLGMIDPPRPEVKDAVDRCKTAGIRTVMITGDHPLTALHIAQELGIADEETSRVMTGQELARASSEELAEYVENVRVYARVSPEHKLRIVDSLQQRGHIVSMTGDGVNDAPALKRADIGVAMGVTGTDVSKEASKMVLLDDNFATIVNAVEQGRIVYDNIRKFIQYTLTSNAGEVWVMLLGPFLGMPLPLLPLQILWINLVTDGLPGLALAIEPAERDTMRRPPHPPNENMFARGLGRHILWVGLLMGLVSLGAGYWYWDSAGAEESYWRTVVFTVLTISQMGHCLAIRSSRESLFRIGLRSNLPLLGSVLLTFVLQLVVVYVPFFQDLFHTVALSAADLLVCAVLSTVVFFAVETEKWFRRRSAATAS